MAKATCKTAYRWSFFFWLDLISTISLLLDIPSLQVGPRHLSLCFATPDQCPLSFCCACFAALSTLTLSLTLQDAQSSLIATHSSRNDIRSSILRAAVRAFQLIRVTRLLQVSETQDHALTCGCDMGNAVAHMCELIDMLYMCQVRAQQWHRCWTL